MDYADLAGQAVDQLCYNQLCAPDYPAEDKTTMDREESGIQDRINKAILIAEKREDIADWLRLASASVADAFKCLREGDEFRASSEFTTSIDRLQKAISQAPHRVDFTVDTQGIVRPVQDGE